MAQLEQEDQCCSISTITQKIQYPLDPSAYKILDEIGIGVSAIVYKAICIPMESTVVAIKAIDLDQSRTDLDNIRRETKTMSLLSHPNILNAHCSFTVASRLWVVMPFMSCGSLQSIISSCFPDGLPEPCIAIVLKETLSALSYLHNQGHLHRDVKAGNILIDSDGSVKLADFGVSASIYEHGHHHHGWAVITDVAGTPYWMAPEVIHSHTGYSFKADIWSFGITALELAHGRPPLSHLPPEKSLLMKMTQRFRFSDYEKTHKIKDKNKKFSRAFKDMVASCLDQDPSKRPSAEKLMKHSFFKNCNKGVEFFVKNVLHGLPSVEERFKESKDHVSVDHDEDEDCEVDSSSFVRQRRISGWNFNDEGFELDPVFPLFTTESREDYDSVVKQVRFGGETIIPLDHIKKQSESDNNSEESNLGTQLAVHNQAAESDQSSDVVGAFDNETVLGGLMALRRSLDEQRQQVSNMIVLLGGEISREDQLMQIVERLKMELETERRKNFELEMELEFLKLQISGACNSGGTD